MFPLKIVIFHTYVGLPEGNQWFYQWFDMLNLKWKGTLDGDCTMIEQLIGQEHRKKTIVGI